VKQHAAFGFRGDKNFGREREEQYCREDARLPPGESQWTGVELAMAAFSIAVGFS